MITGWLPKILANLKTLTISKKEGLVISNNFFLCKVVCVGGVSTTWTLGCEKNASKKETWHITYVENLATQTHENPEDIVNINKSPSKCMWTWTMVPWSHPSTLVIAINQQTKSLWESPDGSILIRFICGKGDVGESTGKVDDLYYTRYRLWPIMAHWWCIILGYPQKYFHIIHIDIYIHIYIYHLILNKSMKVMLKYLDLVLEYGNRSSPKIRQESADIVCIRGWLYIGIC